jgi:hypothetical protein
MAGERERGREVMKREDREERERERERREREEERPSSPSSSLSLFHSDQTLWETPTRLSPLTLHTRGPSLSLLFLSARS